MRARGASLIVLKMSFINFLKSRVFWIQVALAVVAIIVLLSLTCWLLGVYTNSGRTVVVPQLVGQLQAEVQAEVRNGDLDLRLIDSIYRADVRPGAIVDQIPEAGKKVKKGRTIYITINAFSKEMTAMPALVNFSFRNAKVNLQNAGLTLGRVDSVPSPYNGLVLEQSVAGKAVNAGERLPKGSCVDLVVGRGGTEGTASVPNLVGLQYDDAISALAGARLSVGGVSFDASVRTASDSAQAIVLRQSPDSSTGTVDAWSPVNLWLSIDMGKLAEHVLEDE